MQRIILPIIPDKIDLLGLLQNQLDDVALDEIHGPIEYVSENNDSITDMLVTFEVTLKNIYGNYFSTEILQRPTEGRYKINILARKNYAEVYYVRVTDDSPHVTFEIPTTGIDNILIQKNDSLSLNTMLVLDNKVAELIKRLANVVCAHNISKYNFIETLPSEWY